LHGAVHALEVAVDWLLAHSVEEAARCMAGAVPFLRLAGTVIGGWLMARLGEAAANQLATGAGDAAWLRAKVATAHHYAAHVLVQAAALRDTVLYGADTTLALLDEHF
jgi:hypothetical protein